MRMRQILFGMVLLPTLACGTSGQSGTELDMGGGGADMPGGDSDLGPISGSMVSYVLDDTTIFANPERGFYHHEETDGTDSLSQSALTGFRTSESITLVLREFFLYSFRTGSISSTYLNGVTTDLASIRAAGLKTVLRFAYSSSATKPYGDASKDTVLGQIAQLKPILQANADIIATVQVGFIGAWGEWYYTDYFGDLGNVTAAQSSDRKAVVDALLDALPASRTVQLRTPAFKQGFYGTAALTTTEAFSGSAKSRVGHHNDCFLSSDDDQGTYANIAADKAYLGIENLYVPQGGESCATSSYSGWSNASQDLEALHYSFLNRDYLDTVLTSWGSNIDIARRRLGYRLALVDSTFTGTAHPGAEVQLRIHLRNDGYAPPFNPRSVEIIARNAQSGTRLVAKLNADPRRFTPGTTQQLDARLCVPAGTPAGSYALSLALPDPESTLHDRPEYAIRLANTGIWDAASGSHSLNQTVVIAATSAAPTCSSGSISFN